MSTPPDHICGPAHCEVYWARGHPGKLPYKSIWCTSHREHCTGLEHCTVHHRLLSISGVSALGRLNCILYCFAAKRYPDPFHFGLCRPGQQDCQIVVACETPGLQSHRHTALQFNWSPCKGIALRNNLILRLCFTGIALAVCSSDCAGDRSGGQD